MKKIKDMQMWELEEMAGDINMSIRYNGSKLYIDKSHRALCFDSDIFDDVEADLFWNIDISELTKNDLIDYINDYFDMEN